MTNFEIWTLIQQYVSGNCTPRVSREVERWMDLAPANRKLVEEVQKIWDSCPEEEFRVNVNNAWNTFFKKEIEPDLPSRSRSVGSNRPSQSVLYIFRAAAIILVSAFAGFAAHVYMVEPENETHAAGFYLMQELTTDKGEKARITFTDGTQVILNSSSSLRFPKEFNGPAREVYLEGEAFFDVAHDESHPFIVYAQEAKIQVLGTEFNIRGWAEDSKVEVLVSDGKVLLETTAEHLQDSKGVILTRGMRSHLRSGHRPSIPEEVEFDKILLWTIGGLHFDNIPLNRVLSDLERRFNINIYLSNDGVREIPFTGTFQYAEVDEVLSVIAASMELEYTREGSEVKLFR